MGDSDGRKYQKLPPGWDCKYDRATGNCYYINYFTKAMQLEDPRTRYRQLEDERCSNESIAMQPLHVTGGSPYHVYPTNNFPATRAFHTPNSSLFHISTSPLLSTSGPRLDASPLPFPKAPLTQTPRRVNISRRSTIQETSFSNKLEIDSIVAKIQNMFPTASESHIRLLLKKYYNREAVVISALQVEKHPVTMPGPFVTPPAQRHLFHSNSAVYMTPQLHRPNARSHHQAVDCQAIGSASSRTASPIPPGGALGSGHTLFPFHHGSPRFGEWWRSSSPKPHSSPKMKLRYMKTIFPKADETLLLDILANADDNVQKASDKLLGLGYVKRDFVQENVVRHTNAARDAVRKAKDEPKIIPLRPKEYTPEEKNGIEARLKEKYTGIAERILLMALESVNYAEDRAAQILDIVQEEEEQLAKNVAAISLPTTLESNVAETCPPDDDEKSTHCEEKEEPTKNTSEEFKSLLRTITVQGPNKKLAKGPNEKFLLADYVAWNGANPDLTLGQKNIAVGRNASLLGERSYKPFGHNSDLCKGPQGSLAKGSIYAPQNRATASVLDIKCN